MTASTFPAWIYDGSPIPDPLGYGDRAVRFLKLLRHPNSTAPGRAFQLYDWQERIVRRIYGPRHADGSRVVKTVFLLLPRGNRKTSLAAALSLLHLLGPEKVPAGQVIFAASDREQASIGFREAANIVREDKRLMGVTTIRDAFNSLKQITNKQTQGTLRAVSSDGRAQHGTTPSFVLADEIHAWRDRDLWEALRSGAAKVNDSLLIVATTAGRGSETLAAEQYDYARRVALGEIENEEYLPILFEIQPDEDWRDEDVWHRVNPGLAHGFPSLSGLRALAKEAEHRPGDAYAFQQFNLNRWLANSRDPLFDLTVYDEGETELDESELEELPCYLGVDLSVNGDLSAVVAAWRHDDGRVTIKPTLFVPSEDLKGRADRDGAPYPAWLEGGHIVTCPGPIIDRDQIEDHIRELCARYQVEEIAVDPALARTLMQNLADASLPVLEFRQAPLTMGPAAGDLERTVHGRLLRHDGNPALRHHFENVVASRNDMGLIRMHKAKRTDRIDGAIASAMAVSRACAGNTKSSAYNDPEAELFIF